jgi:cell division protein FtsB
MRIVTKLGLKLLTRVLRSGSMVVGSLVLLYFGLLAFDTDRGFAALKQVRAEVAVAETRLAETKTQREEVERKVVALRSGSLDTDLLEEQTRKSLGYTRPGEIVIYGK